MRQDSHFCEIVLGAKTPGKPPEATFWQKQKVEIEARGRAKPPEATAKPYSRHILGICSGAQSHPKATPKPPQSPPKTPPKPPPKPHPSHTKAPRKPPSSRFGPYEKGCFLLVIRGASARM